MITFNDGAFIQEFKEFVESLNVESALEVDAKSDELGNAIADIIQIYGVDNDILSSKSRKKYDLVFSVGLLQHLTEDEMIKTIEKMAGLSKKYVLNYVPNSNCLAYIKNKAKIIDEWENEKDFTIDSLRTVYEVAGLNVVQTGVVAKEWAKRFGNEPSEGYLVYVLAKKSN